MDDKETWENESLFPHCDKCTRPANLSDCIFCKMLAKEKEKDKKDCVNKT